MILEVCCGLVSLLVWCNDAHISSDSKVARLYLTFSAYLIQDDSGQPLTQGALRSRFDKARTLAQVEFQFRDISAKAATDTGDLAHSQKLLADKKRDMTEHYVKARLGERVPVRPCHRQYSSPCHRARKAISAQPT